jgi:hypothetical protein
MAGRSNNGKTPKPLTRKQQAARKVRKRSLQQAIELAKDAELNLNRPRRPVSTTEIMDELTLRVHDLWLWVQNHTNEINEPDFWIKGRDYNGNIYVEPEKWFQLERSLREELFEMTRQMTALDIDERRIRVEELQLSVLGRALQAALRDANVDAQTQKVIGARLRQHIAAIEGSITVEPNPDGPPAPPAPVGPQNGNEELYQKISKSRKKAA